MTSTSGTPLPRTPPSSTPPSLPRTPPSGTPPSLPRTPPSSTPSGAGIADRLRGAGCINAEDEARMLVDAARTPDELSTMVDQRVGGRPLEHVLGWAEFCDLRIAVDPGVFVPRRRSEFLVMQAAALARAAALPRPPVVVVDLCCGSGALGAALAAILEPSVGPVELHAADVDPAAVRCARRSLTSGAVYQGDLFDPLPDAIRGRVDILVANVPYVPSDEIRLMPPEARLHEQLAALDGGADGLDVLRRVAAAAPGWLAPGGHLLVETSERQVDSAAGILDDNRLAPRLATCDDGATVVIGTTAPPT